MDSEEERTEDDDARTEEEPTIGARARFIRRRRGLSLDVAAGLAGISKPYLSQLENGQRGFNRRGLVEDLADALSCSVADLTGQPYPTLDRATIEGRATLPGISLALNDFGPDDLPNVHPRSLDELVAWADTANEHRDQGRSDPVPAVRGHRFGVGGQGPRSVDS